MARTIKILTAAALAAAAAGAMAQSRLLGGRTVRPGAALPAAAGAADASSVTASAAGVDEAAEEGKAPALNFNEAPLDLVLDTYAKLVDRTVLKDPNTPDATITLQSRPGQTLTKEDQIEAIEVKLEMHGIHLENYGVKFVRALPRDKARTEAIPFVDEDAELEESGRVVSTMITFKNIPIEEAKTALEGLKSQRGQLLVYERIGKINVTDTQMSILRMRQLRNEIDVATPINENVFVRQIKNASASEIKTALEQIVAESQKELEKAGKAAQTAQAGGDRARALATTPSGTLLRRPGAPGAPGGGQPAAPANVESLVTSVSDADRGMIRGKVLIMSDERSNKLIVVTAKTNMDFFDKVIEQLDVETTPDTLVRVYRLKYAEAEDVSDMINDLIGNTQKSSSRENQNPASRSGQGGNLTRGGQQPQRGGNNFANQRNNSGNDAKAGELTKDNTTVLADKRTNGLVIMTQKELLPTVESIIEAMDIKLSQVLIETAIIEVTLGDGLNTGVDWVLRGKQTGQVGTTKQWQRVITGYNGTDANSEPIYAWEQVDVPIIGAIRDGGFNRGSSMLGGGGGSGASLLSSLVGAGTNLVSAATPAGSGINYLLKSDKLNLAAVISATKTDNRAKYIASPIVMTVDNKDATIEATSSRQFLTGWQAVSSSYAGSGLPSPQYASKDIGIKLKITPKINPNGTVMLTVNEEYSQVSETQTMLSPQGNSYVTTEIDVPVTRTMESDVLLDNNQTVILGGLTENTTVHRETGIPILKDIPFIGKWLFGKVEDVESRKELLIFLTPRVLNDSEMAQAEAIRRKNSLSDARPWDTHGWSFSELADPVANKELMRRLKDEAERQDEERKNRLAVEKWKLDRAKALERMTDSERKFWIEQHRDELEKEEKKAFDKYVEEQKDLKELADAIRANDLEKAEATIKENGEGAKTGGEQ